jgi:arylamine N-acetyltransferase
MIESLKKIIRINYETIPFHNFGLILKSGLNPSINGGICTDKNYYLYNKLREEGFSVKLHSSEINGQSIHQLIKVDIGKQSYLIDVGLGWPILHPIPLFCNSKQDAFGIEFEAKIENNQLFLFMIKENEKTLSYTSNIYEYCQSVVLDEIKNSYSESINYPFNSSIRFSKIVNNEFYFLKGDILYYSKNKVLLKTKIQSVHEFDDLFVNVFKYDLGIAKQVCEKLIMF